MNRGVALHSARVGVFAAIILLIHQQHARFRAQQAERELAAVRVEEVREFFPSADVLRPSDSARGGRAIIDPSRQTLGYVVQTSPVTDGIIGYSGPTNTLVFFNRLDQVVGLRILSSGDTREHVEKVQRDPAFLKSFNGREWGLPTPEDKGDEKKKVDAVSGATLTSLAIAEGLALRLSGQRPSLRFPEPIELAEVQRYFPSAASVTPRRGQPGLFHVADAAGSPLGTVLRSSPASDDEIGYMGPTDTLTALDAREQVIGYHIRRSYETPKYVDQVWAAASFRESLNGRALGDLRRVRLKHDGIDAVSGATMTCESIIDGIRRAARAALRPSEQRPAAVTWTARDAGMLSVLAAACLLGFTRLRGVRWLRVLFQLVLIVYLGFLNGDLLSQALLVGWAQSGVPWRLAPGLVLLSAAALASPILSRRQLYCHHVCPFGAAQQLIRHRLPWQLSLPARAAKTLELVPGLLLAVVLLVALWHWPLDLAAIEPFDAFSWGVAGAATISVAIVGLAASALVPMAYCRFGCPTGALLNGLRYNRHSGRLTRRDALALVLLAAALAVRWA